MGYSSWGRKELVIYSCDFCLALWNYLGFPGGSVVKNPLASAGATGDTGSVPGSGRSPGEGNGNLLPVFLSRKSHGLSSLVGYTPQGHKESDITKRLNRNNRVKSERFNILMLTRKLLTAIFSNNSLSHYFSIINLRISN